MSEHQRGAWGSREDNSVAAATAAAAASSVWWPSAADQQSQHQQLLTQHHQQQLAAAVQQQQQQQHEAAARSTAAAAAAQQFLSYKMANNNFQNIISSANTNSLNSSQINTGGGMRYDYGGGGGGGGGGGPNTGRPGDAALAANQAAQAAAAAAQWWSYPGAVAAAGLQNNPNLQNHLQNTNAVNTLLNRGRMPKRGGIDAKPRGRMTAYAFFVQTCREEHKKKHPDETVIFKEFSKKCAERWKTMSDKEKKRFHEMADKDKKRYDTEMQSYVPAKGEKGLRKKRKQMKDPNAPKRSLSAFFWFCNDERGGVKATNPDYGVGDIAKELGRKWADAEPHTKQKYEAMAEKDKARYEREMMEYKKKSKPGGGIPIQALKESDGEDAEDDGDEDDE